MQRIKLHGQPDEICFGLSNGKDADISWKMNQGQILVEIKLQYEGVFGLGEKFDGLNQKGKCPVSRVEEKFCYQGEKTYCPAPFFFTDTGLGVYADTACVTKFEFLDTIRCEVPVDTELILFTGQPGQILAEYMQLFGKPVLPPRYAFGPWISANHWDSQKDTEHQVKLLKQYHFPATVLVLEAWSDEATFYQFHGAKYQGKTPEQPQYHDFDFEESGWWDNPKEMIDMLHREGIHLVLWQIPVYKKQGPEETVSASNERDRREAIEKGLCVKNQDGSPYEIPEGHWFAGSWIPDFTNPETLKSWFGKRQYLLDIGVDGFKTDGGEFIYSEDVVFAAGSTGREGINRYAQDYLNAYTDFIAKDRILFSRAGYVGAHRTPIHWAGDHQSDNDEFKSTLSAGLSAAASGIVFWGFDIGGFGGKLPSLDLYRRATQMACFCPVMQWHSEPDGGQFGDWMPGASGNNERSPWNLANANQAPQFITEMRYWHWLRMNLLPYIYSCACECVKSYTPMMRPLVYDWPEDERAVQIEDEYCFGESILVAPLMEENSSNRELYLPEGGWYGFFSKKRVEGKRNINSAEEKFPVYIREHRGVALQIQEGTELGEPMEKEYAQSGHLHFILAGNTGSYVYDSGDGVIHLTWEDAKVSVTGADRDGLTWEIWN